MRLFARAKINVLAARAKSSADGRKFPACAVAATCRPLFPPPFAAEAARDASGIRRGPPAIWAGQGRTAPAPAAPRRSRTIIQRKAEAARVAALIRKITFLSAALWMIEPTNRLTRSCGRTTERL